MNPDVLKIMAMTAGAIISAPVILMSVKVVQFFTTLDVTVKATGGTVAAMGVELKESTRTMVENHKDLAEIVKNHEGRITVIEAERRIEAKQVGRHEHFRATDRLADELPDHGR